MKPYRKMLVALLRISIGWIFLWAFLDKLFGLGYSTCRVDGAVDVLCSKSWLMGGSPTAGFLGHASGPLASVFQAMSGTFVDWLFMLGLLGIGVSLMFGAGMKLGTYGGAVLMLFMWLSAMPTSNPFMDDHIIYAIVLVLLRWLNAGHYYGLGEWWEKHSLVKKHPWLD